MGEWISVKDGLPNLYERVIVCINHGAVGEGERREMEGKLISEGLWDWRLIRSPWVAVEVTHWMPLPEPPK